MTTKPKLHWSRVGHCGDVSWDLADEDGTWLGYVTRVSPGEWEASLRDEVTDPVVAKGSFNDCKAALVAAVRGSA